METYIEDTILLALQGPEVYDEIARGTRCKFETNRPRTILFEGPPGLSLDFNTFINTFLLYVTMLYNQHVDDVEAVMDEERRKRMEWEKEMRIRVKEIEDSRELEKKAEELQSRGEGDGEEEGEGEEEEETEEEKRMRVRRELEKVRVCFRYVII